MQPSDHRRECAFPFYHPKTGNWHYDCISAGGSFSWCSLDEVFDPERSLWGICSEKKLHYSTHPGLGCITMKLNGNVVLREEPLQEQMIATAEFKGTPVCPTGNWHCHTGPDPPVPFSFIPGVNDPTFDLRKATGTSAKAPGAVQLTLTTSQTVARIANAESWPEDGNRIAWLIANRPSTTTIRSTPPDSQLWPNV